jgi:protocatechuate 3,4-dioxygenase beta subunit
MRQSRRGLIGSSLLLGAGLAAPALAIPHTIPMDLGPFYPNAHPADTDLDLTRIAGRPGQAKGEIMEVAGRVLDRDGKPVAGARLDIWQANAVGRYAHRGDRNDRPLDPDFQGFAALKTDAEGRYRIRTIKPGAYPAGDYMRARHIHFSVDGHDDRLITQLYFADDTLLDQDKTLLRDLRAKSPPYPESIFGKRGEAKGGTPLDGFDIVLRNG